MIYKGYKHFLTEKRIISWKPSALKHNFISIEMPLFNTTTYSNTDSLNSLNFC